MDLRLACCIAADFEFIEIAFASVAFQFCRSLSLLMGEISRFSNTFLVEFVESFPLSQLIFVVDFLFVHACLGFAEPQVVFESLEAQCSFCPLDIDGAENSVAFCFMEHLQDFVIAFFLPVAAESGDTVFPGFAAFGTGVFGLGGFFLQLSSPLPIRFVFFDCHECEFVQASAFGEFLSGFIGEQVEIELLQDAQTFEQMAANVFAIFGLLLEGFGEPLEFVFGEQSVAILILEKLYTAGCSLEFIKLV